MKQKPNSLSLRPLALPFLVLPLSALLTSCGGGGGGSPAPTPLATVSSTTAATAGAAAATGLFSQRLLITVNGADLDQGITVASAGCSGITRLTAAPTASTATTAFYDCNVSAVGAQTVSVARSVDNASLSSAAYTVAVPQVTVTVGNGATSLGNFVITLEPARAPITTTNFLAYIRSGFYVGTAYHRRVTGFVVQGGGYAAPITAATTPSLKPTGPAIVLEDGAGLLNLRYTMAMARTSAPDSATSQFFINLANNANLDRSPTIRGYAVFGTVTSGTDVVDAMAAAPCTAATYSECVPVPNLTITAATQTR